ncbi:MAG: RluA family pseudouridine synthase [Proteobacteria bacterium]|nr:RluA family pseudouridine synthase [Pseudomonadota bacterium]
MNEREIFCVTVEESEMRLDAYLSRKYPELGRSRLKEAIESGAVLIDGRAVTKASRKCHVHEVIDIERPSAPVDPKNPQAEAIPFEILYEDEAIFVIHKPSGLVVHPGAGHPTGTLVNGLLAIDPAIAQVGEADRPGIVHRLDRETSGLMLVARTNAAYSVLVEMFSRHAVQRRYWAICHAPRLNDSGTFDTPYGRHPTQRVKFTSCHLGNGKTECGDYKRAITHYTVVSRSLGGFALIQCDLETGRTHQVRVHLSEHGAPILGDTLYAPQQYAHHRAIDRLALHAGALSFSHPIRGDAMHFEVPLPEAFDAALRKLGIDYDER